jgi:gluconate kinase
MPAALLDSQVAALEPLAPGEPGWVVDVRNAAPAIVDAIVQQLAARGPV